MKNQYKYLSDLPKSERKRLEREILKSNKKIRLWNGFIIGFAILLPAITTSSQMHGKIIEMFECVLLTVGFTIIFRQSIVHPMVKEEIEKKLNS